MTVEFCGSPVCAARVQFFLCDPGDPLVREPCARCVDAFARTLGVAAGETLRSVYAAVLGGPS